MPTRYQDLTTRDARDSLGEHCRRSRRHHHRQGSAHPWRYRHRHHVCHERHQVTGTNALHRGFSTIAQEPEVSSCGACDAGLAAGVLCHGDASSALSRRLSSILRIIQTSPNSTSAEKAMVGESHR